MRVDTGGIENGCLRFIGEQMVRIVQIKKCEIACSKSNVRSDIVVAERLKV